MFTIYQTKAEALMANTQAAIANGCDLVVTTEWHPRFNHEDGRSALEDGVGPVTREELEADGWFPAFTAGEGLVLPE